MVAGRRHKTTHPKKKDLLLIAKAVTRASYWIVSVSYSLKSHRDDIGTDNGCLYTQWVALQNRNTGLTGFSAFVANRSKLALCLEEDITSSCKVGEMQHNPEK